MDGERATEVGERWGWLGQVYRGPKTTEFVPNEYGRDRVIGSYRGVIHVSDRRSQGGGVSAGNKY